MADHLPVARWRAPSGADHGLSLKPLRGTVGDAQEMEMTEDEFAPVTPGEMLKDEFLAEYGLSQNQLARAVGISPNRIAEIVNNRRRISADTALRLGLYFGNSPEFWMNLQTHYDLKIARRNLRPEEVERIKALRAA
jgi:antitoxin HigA-1